MEVLVPTIEDIVTQWEDRRKSRRRSLAEIPSIVGANLRSQSVEVLDISAGGLLIQCGFRLAPGEISQLELLRVDGPLRMRGRVVRSEVALVSGRGMTYRIAIEFNSALNGIDEKGPILRASEELVKGDFMHLSLLVAPSRAELLDAFTLNDW